MARDQDPGQWAPALALEAHRVQVPGCHPSDARWLLPHLQERKGVGGTVYFYDEFYKR